MAMKVTDRKFRLLEADEIECRVAMVKETGISLLLYKDARCDQNILDETVGPMNWQRHHNRDNANCIVSIWDSEKKQWVEKEDTGTQSNTEAEKGLASDSFKRACFNWGIGRELYTAPFIWIYADDCRIKRNNKGKLECRDNFVVKEIEYDEAGKITTLKIENEDMKRIVYPAPKKGGRVPVNNGPSKEAVRAEVLQLAQMQGYTPAQLAQDYKLNANSSVEQLIGVLDDLKQKGGIR